MKAPVRPILAACLACMVVYVVTYAVNSSLGGYWMKPKRDTHDCHVYGLSMSTAINWQPRVGYQTCFVTDGMGYFYWTLIRLDRRLFHPTHYLSDNNGLEWCESLPIASIHPQFRQEAEGVRASQSGGKTRKTADSQH